MKSYITGLNGIRAIAVFMVIISHRFPADHFLRIFPIGHYGVDVFFVLSGFLISRGLFNQIAKNDKKSDIKSNFQILKKFFLNRSLRIFPIYYLLLLFMYLTKGIIGNNYSENIMWYLFYSSNYLVYFNDRWFGALAHLWSLSVEEQFYVFFPLLLLFVFKNRIMFFLILLILIGTIYPFFVNGLNSVLTLSCINSFGIGGVLAYLEIFKSNLIPKFYKYTSILCIPIMILIIIHNLFFYIPFFSERLAISIIAIYIISLCYFKPNSFVVDKFLNNKFLNFIGIISYGIYLYHNIVPKYWNYLSSKLPLFTNDNKFNYFEFFLQTIIIILLSYFSWILIEKPILKFKKNN